jgi:hypothetical protein
MKLSRELREEKYANRLEESYQVKVLLILKQQTPFLLLIHLTNPAYTMNYAWQLVKVNFLSPKDST